MKKVKLEVTCFMTVLMVNLAFCSYANYTGDVILGGLFPIHNYEDGACREIQEEDGIQMLEAMLFTLDEINNDRDFLPGFTIGAVGLDSCDNDAHALEQAVEFVKVLVTKATSTNEFPYMCSDGKKAKLRQGAIDFHQVVGVVGGSTSSVTIQVANLLRLFKVPQISYLATSPDLSNKERFDYFQRTVPSDSSQAKAILGIVNQLNWTYVSGVFEDSNYGLKGFGELERILEEDGKCFAIKEKIQLEQNRDNKYYDKIVANLLSKPHAKGVIVFADFIQARSLFEAANRSSDPRVYDFVWIGSDGWSSRDVVVNGLERLIDGSLTVQPLARHLTGFSDYFKNLRPETNNRNPWFKEFWQHHFDKSGCGSGTNLRIGGPCSRYRENLYAHFVHDAVYAFAHALKAMHRKMCGANYTGLCPNMTAEHISGQDLLHFVKSVNFTDSNNEPVYFIDGTDAPAKYSILHYTKRPLKRSLPQYHWNQVGSYIDIGEGSSILNLDVDFERKIASYPQSVCSKPCKVGQAQKYVENDLCCWYCVNCTERQYLLPTTGECENCPLGSWPDNARNSCIPIQDEYLTFDSPWAIGTCTFSSLGIVITIIISVIFYLYRDTPVIKASGRELSAVLLGGIFTSYVATFLFVSKPSAVTCGFTRFLLGICYTICSAAILTKTNRIARIFNHTKDGPAKTKIKYTDPKSQLIITTVIVSIQLLILTLWLIIYPPKTTHIYPELINNILICSGADNFSYLVALIYPFMLVIACTVYAIKTRKTPDGFNETQYIAFTNYTTCVIWLAFVSLYFASSSYYLKTVTLSMSVALSATVQLVCLFVPKLYVCILRPHKNTRDRVMAKAKSSSQVNSGSGGQSHHTNKPVSDLVITDNRSSSGISLGYSNQSLASTGNVLNSTSITYLSSNEYLNTASVAFPNGVTARRKISTYLTDDLLDNGLSDLHTVRSSTPQDDGNEGDRSVDVRDAKPTRASFHNPQEADLNRARFDQRVYDRTGSPDSGCNTDLPISSRV